MNKIVKIVGGGGLKRNALFQELVSWDNLNIAWANFRLGKTKKLDTIEFRSNLRSNLNAIQKELKSKTYKHSKYATFYVKDPKLRKINKACVKDRIVHHALFRKLYYIFDRAFIFDSYSCRIKKGTHRAVRRLNDFFKKESQNNTKICWALKCDIRKFFDNIDQKILINLIRQRVKDKNVIWLIEVILKSFENGLPLGNITSQLFANIYLNQLDQFVKHRLRVKYYIRYSDDFVILNVNKQCLENLISQIDKFLQDTLKLSLHSNKIVIKKYYQGIDFLGYVSFPSYIILRLKTKKRILKKIKSKIKDWKSGKLEYQSFNQSMQSYLGVLKHCNSEKIKKELINLLKFADFKVSIKKFI